MLKGIGANLDFAEKWFIFVVPTEQAADFSRPAPFLWAEYEAYYPGVGKNYKGDRKNYAGDSFVYLLRSFPDPLIRSF